MLLALKDHVSVSISWMFDKEEFDTFLAAINENDPNCHYNVLRMRKIRAFYTRPADGTILLVTLTTTMRTNKIASTKPATKLLQQQNQTFRTIATKWNSPKINT